VNNTILIVDSETGQGAHDLIATNLAGSAWGIIVCKGDLWVLVAKEPSVQPPWKGLISYSEFVNQRDPIPAEAKKKEIREVKERRREKLKRFCEVGEPGEAMKTHLSTLLGKLSLPEELRGSQAAIDAGVCGNNIRILPSFLYLLQELKKAGRTFSILFRTFGADLNEVFEKEFNAFCEGRHPLFPDGLVLDGSDGRPDHRMDLSDETVMGTFVRGLEDDSISLVWGTHFQPEPQEGGIKWYIESQRADPEQKLEIIQGVEEVAQNLEARVMRQSKSIAIRDFYDSWAATRFRGIGGKPFFLNMEDHHKFQMFFDDTLRPTDPTIVDPIDARDYPVRIPAAQVFNIHMVTASPLRSIAEPTYFMDMLDKCEKAKSAQRERRRKVARLLHSIAGLRIVIHLLAGPDREELSYVSSPGGSLALGSLTLSRQISRRSSHSTSDSSVPIGEDHKTCRGSVANGLRFTKWAEQDEVVRFAPLPPDAEDPPEMRKLTPGEAAWSTTMSAHALHEARVVGSTGSRKTGCGSFLQAP